MGKDPVAARVLRAYSTLPFEVPRAEEGDDVRAWVVLPRSGWGVGEDKQEERWTVQRKLDVVAAVESGQIPLRKAMADYLMDVEEYISWRDMAKRHGPLALRVTKLQEYTRRHPRADMRKRVRELA